MGDQKPKDEHAGHASLVEETRDEHAGCLKLLTELEACLDRPAGESERWLSELRAKLGELDTAMRRHFEGEEAGPVFRELPQRHPRLAAPLGKLEAEHREMLEQMESVQRKADALDVPTDYELRELNARVQLLVARIRRHEAAENELVIQAHWDEIGVGD